MRKSFLKRLIIIAMTTLIIADINSTSAFAVWKNNEENSTWSWVEEDGKQTVGWKQIENKWYNFDENGVMKTGWLKDNDKWYKLSDDGSMLTNWHQEGDKWYHFDENGIMKTGWLKDDDKWYDFDEDGSMKTGWIKENGTWYYANTTGDLQTGTISIDGVTYTFLDDGSMVDDNNSSSDSTSGEETSQPAVDVSDVTESTEVRKGYVNTNSGILNVRSEASIHSDIIGTLPRGSEVEISSNAKDGFYSITFSGKKGWVSSEWISFEKPADIVNPAPAGEDNTNENIVLKDDSLGVGTIRTTEPSLDNMYYYSDYNIFYKVRLSPPFKNSAGNPIKGNCTWYAWGRIWEVTGQKPTDAGFIGNAYEWWQANINSGKYKYGSEPKVGAVAVWKSGLPGSGGCGHVAMVEKIENGKIYISESMWHGQCFKYQEIYETNYLAGYIYVNEPNF